MSSRHTFIWDTGCAKKFCYLNVLYNYVYIFVYLCTISGVSIGTDRAEWTV